MVKNRLNISIEKTKNWNIEHTLIAELTLTQSKIENIKKSIDVLNNTIILQNKASNKLAKDMEYLMIVGIIFSIIQVIITIIK